MTAEFDHQIRVYYEDTDAGGIVYHASYIRYAERGRTELLRHHGYQNSELLSEAGVLFVVRHMDIDFLKPARLDDLLTVSTSIGELRNSSLFMRQNIKHDTDIICSLRVGIVTVNQNARPVRIPEDLRTLFETYTT